MQAQPTQIEEQEDDVFLLHSKLCPPTLPEKARQLDRPEILEKLHRGFQRKLTLVVAPAGFGKTTAVLQALQEQPFALSWLSLEPSEGQLPAFLGYLIASLRQLYPGVGQQTQRRLQSLPQPPLHKLLGPLLNELQECEERPSLLVLDDYHNASTQEIDDAMCLLLQHAPPHLHFVVTSRTLPSWPLSLWRARMMLMELNAPALRLTQQESEALLCTHLKLPLEAKEAARLHETTEGWIAALQLAGHSLQCAPDREQFFHDFKGDDQYISDFLLQEVYLGLPQETQAFLMDSSVLTSFTAGLCDQLREQEDSAAQLKALEAAQVFLIPLDARRRLYRYHHLFQHWLQRRLQEQQPTRWRELHHRAAAWYMSRHSLEQALEHSFAAGDLTQATQWLATQAPLLATQGCVAPLFKWLARLGIEEYKEAPSLAAIYASLFIAQGHIQALARWLPRLLRAFDDADESALETHEQGVLSLLQAHMSWLSRDKENAYHQARQAHEKIGQAHPFLSIEAGLLACRTGLALGENVERTLENCEALRKECIEQQNLFYLPPLVDLYATILTQQGQLTRATALCEETLSQITTWLGPDERFLPTLATLYIRLAKNAYKRNQLAQAQHYMVPAMQIAQDADDKRTQHAVQVTLARLYYATGEQEEALRLLDALDHLSVDPSKRRAWEQAHAAFLMHQLGRTDQWKRWCQKSRPHEHGTLHFTNQIEALVWATALVKEKRWEEAEVLLTKLETFGVTHSMQGCLCWTKLLQAQAHFAQGRHTEATQLLFPVLRATAKEDMKRLYLDAGQEVATMLAKALRSANKDDRDVIQEHVQSILADFPQNTPAPSSPTTREVAHMSPPTLSLQRYQLDPLSPRELEVLELVSLGYTNQALAQQLHISLATVKTHTRNIYSKLDVKNRTQAVQQARHLGLLPS